MSKLLVLEAVWWLRGRGHTVGHLEPGRMSKMQPKELSLGKETEAEFQVL